MTQYVSPFATNYLSEGSELTTFGLNLIDKLTSGEFIVKVRDDVFDSNTLIDVVFNIVEKLDNNIVSCRVNTESLDRGGLEDSRLNKHDRIVRVNK